MRVLHRALPALAVIAILAAGAGASGAHPTARAPQIAFYRESDSGEGSVYLVNSDGSGLKRLARGGGASCSSDEDDSRSLDWSADGSLLAYTDLDVGNDTASINVIRPGGRPHIVVPSDSSYLGPRISPNGRFVAYCYETNPDSRDDSIEVKIANVRGPADSRTLNDTDTENAFDPAWSPKSDVIAYINLSELVIVAPSGEKKVAVEVAAEEPDWSPSGTRIAYATGAGVETVGADGKDRVRVARIRGAAGPVWSPGGRTIAFSASPTGADEKHAVYEANPDGSGFRRMTPPSLNAIEPVWSPDGTKLAFSVPGKGIFVASAKTPNAVSRITRGNDLSPAWRPR
jgi:hypothetical protein